MTGDAEIARTELGSLPWLELRGSRRGVFSAIGREFGEVIRRFLDRPEEREREARARRSPHLEAVLEATRRALPDPVAELEAMAEGAGIPSERLLLLNLRGDLGYGRDGCSDLALVGPAGRWLVHNEDGAPVHEGDCALLTLHIEDDQPFTTYWYPGMLVGMTFWLNAAGVVCGVDHVPVAVPGNGVGRQFLARHLTGAVSLDDLVGRTEEVPVAGGYAYLVGSADEGRLLILEVGPSGTSARQVLARAAHTNHFLSLSDRQVIDAQSRPRLEVLEALPEADTPRHALDAFTDPAGGVYRDASGEDPLMTLCSVVFDLDARSVFLRPRGEEIHELPFERLLSPSRP